MLYVFWIKLLFYNFYFILHLYICYISSQNISLYLI